MEQSDGPDGQAGGLIVSHWRVEHLTSRMRKRVNSRYFRQFTRLCIQLVIALCDDIRIEA
jgi:hypothetical protein